MASCAPCKQILDLDILLKEPASSNEAKPYVRHHSSFPEFLECVSRRDCPICVAVWESRDTCDEVGIVTDDLRAHWDDIHTPVVIKFLAAHGAVSPTAARWVISSEGDNDGHRQRVIGMLRSWTTEGSTLPSALRSASRGDVMLIDAQTILFRLASLAVP